MNNLAIETKKGIPFLEGREIRVFPKYTAAVRSKILENRPEQETEILPIDDHLRHLVKWLHQFGFDDEDVADVLKIAADELQEYKSQCRYYQDE